MVRVTAAADGSLRIGASLPGRGAWLCVSASMAPNPSCVERAAKHGSMKRTLRVAVDPAVIRALVEPTRISILIPTT